MGHSPRPRPVPFPDQLTPEWACAQEKGLCGQGHTTLVPCLQEAAPPNPHPASSTAKASTCSWIIWGRRPLSAQCFWPLPFWNGPGWQCGQVWDGAAETGGLWDLFMQLGPLPWAEGVGGEVEEEGAAGVPGEMTPLPHICVHGPSQSYTWAMQTQMHTHTFTQTHTHIQVYTLRHTCIHVCAHV